MTVFIV